MKKKKTAAKRTKSGASKSAKKSDGSVLGFSLLKKKKPGAETGGMKSAIEGKSHPPLMFEIERMRSSLSELTAFAEEELINFKFKFKPQSPSDLLYQSEYMAALQQITWFYRRISSGLLKNDLPTLERCFEQLKMSRSLLSHVDALLISIEEPQKSLANVKSAALALYNGAGGKENLQLAINSSRDYIEGLSAANEAEFEKIPENKKSKTIILMFENLKQALNDYKTCLASLDEFLENKDPKLLVQGMVGLKTAQAEITRILD